MSFDRVDPFSAGYGRPGPQRPGTPPNFAGKNGSGNPSNHIPDLTVPLAGAASKSFGSQWAQNSFTYGSHSVAAELINRATSPEAPLGQKIQSVQITKNLNASAMGKTLEQAPKAVSYSDLLHLGNTQTPVHKMSWDRFSNTWKTNVQEFGERIKPSNIRNFFAETSGKDYLKNTVVAGNLQPIRNLKNPANNREIGTGLMRTFVVGLLGYDVVKNTSATYKHVKAQEDGSLKSKWRTFTETSKAFGKYSARDGTSWEVAGVGAAIGRAVLPLAVCGVSAGGILVGALAGVLAEKGLDKLLHTGDQDPNRTADEKKEAGLVEGGEGNDDSRAGPAKR